jgi:hypothetical protein
MEGKKNSTEVSDNSRTSHEKSGLCEAEFKNLWVE